MDFVDIDDWWQPVSAINDRLAGHHAIEFRGDSLLSVAVQIASCFVKQEDLSFILQQTSGDENPLSFATRELSPKVSNHCVVALWKAQDFVMDLTLSGDLVNFLLSGIWVAILEIEKDSIVEQNTVLWYYWYVLSEALKLEILNVLTIDQDFSPGGIVNTEKQI
jgi:hypothetical protein